MSYRIGDEVNIQVYKRKWMNCQLAVRVYGGVVPMLAAKPCIALVFDVWNDHADGRQRIRVEWDGDTHAHPRSGWFIVGKDIRPQNAVVALGKLAEVSADPPPG